MRFEIGQDVWRATFDSRDAAIICPDCAGEGRIRVILADDTKLSIGCELCRYGYDNPTGRVRIYERTARAEPTHVTGVEINGQETRWRVWESYIVDDGDLFLTQAEALTRAEEIAVVAAQEELARIGRREKPTHTWAWNASYHRKQIREAQRQIEYHTAKLNVAKIKAKEPVSA